jgi:hypothetical protein
LYDLDHGQPPLPFGDMRRVTSPAGHMSNARAAASPVGAVIIGERVGLVSASAGLLT